MVELVVQFERPVATCLVDLDPEYLSLICFRARFGYQRLFAFNRSIDLVGQPFTA